MGKGRPAARWPDPPCAHGRARWNIISKETIQSVPAHTVAPLPSLCLPVDESEIAQRESGSALAWFYEGSCFAASVRGGVMRLRGESLRVLGSI